ncbi:hypothetical protein ACFXEL_35475 [Streptomyces sp. NPDC059382]|uniref:hypothetical protein n=1 Tax=Streptomyces sp. NPDC059382 TaxID=3346816 RepID=UPI00369504B9
MDPVGLACVVLPVTALLYGLLGVRIRQERVSHRGVSHRGDRSLTTAEAEPLPGTGRRLPDASFAVVLWAGLTVIVATAVAMIGTNPHGPVEGTAAAAIWLAVVAQIVFLVRYGRLRDGSPQRTDLAEAPMRVDPQPAFTAPASRNPRSAARLRVGRIRTRRVRYRGRPRPRRSKGAA